VGFAKHFGPASVREWARPAKGSAKATPVGMAGGELYQTLKPFLRTGRRTVAFPFPLQFSSTASASTDAPTSRIATNSLSRY